MSVIYNYCTGHFSQIQQELVRAFGQYARHNEYIKVGITNDPSRRWREHIQADKWQKLIVVYETTSRDIAAKAEREIINYARNSKHIGKVWNDVGGGGGPSSSSAEKYYVYFLVDNDS